MASVEATVDRSALRPARQPVAKPAPSGRGLALCLISAVAFGLAAVFAKECFSTGISVETLLAGRFGIAGLVFWSIVAVRRPARPRMRVILSCLGLGGIGYALQAACYFTALTKIDASLVGQILYIYPALVVLLALGLRQESLSRRILVALCLSIAGLVVLLHFAGSGGPVASAGLLLAFGAAVTYALYITAANRLPGSLDVYLLSALVCTSAAVSVGSFGAATGSLRLPEGAAAWGWLLLLSLVSTVVSIGCFLGGLRLVGASTAAILSCVEPVVTAGSAVLVFGEHLNLGQVVGGAAVLAAVVVLRASRQT